MSSSNNAASEDTVINIDATISNQNQSTAETGNHPASPTADNPDPVSIVHENLISLFRPSDVATDVDLMIYLVLILASLVLGTYYIFPILFPISLCSLFMAFYGNYSGKYYFFIPFMHTVVWNTFYGIICVIFYITFYASDKEFFLNKALYFCWAEKAEIFEKISDIWILFVSHLIITVIGILLGIGFFFATKQQYAKLQTRYLKEFRRVFGEQAVKSFRVSLQQRGLSIVSNEQFQVAQSAQATHNLSNEVRNPYAQMLARIPPPPSYESNTRLSPPQTQINGIPPPTYSMLEREEQLELDPLHDDSSQHSINNQLLSDTTQNSNTTLLSPINNSNDSTPAMSPSSSSILD